MKKIFATLLAASLLLIGTQAHAQLATGAGYLFASETTSTNNSTCMRTAILHINIKCTMNTANQGGSISLANNAILCKS